MTNNYTDKVAINSSMLGALLANFDEQSLGSIGNILKDDNVKKFLKDEELIATVELFFKNNLNIIKTSKDAIIHRNTLIYRLEKIKKTLGLDIRKFEDAVTLQIILVLKRLEQKRKRRTNKMTRLQKI
ncbi:MAG: helix-turn-helix domain-containing protein [Clostridia bacterium]|nr:helix-turn-helix domain-containing protein [Clostridia bacterium]